MARPAAVACRGCAARGPLSAALGAAVLASAVGGVAAARAESRPPQPRRVVYGAAEDFAPYEYRGPDGAAHGFNVALLRALAQEAGVQVEFRLGPWPAMLERFEQGGVDLVSLRGTEERAARYDVLERTWTITAGVAYRAGTAPPVGAAPRLAGQLVAVKRGSWLAQGLERLAEPERPVLLLTESRAEALLELSRGKARAAVGDELALRWDAQRLGLGELEYRPIASHAYHLVARRGEAAGYAWVEPALERLRRRGVIDRLAEAELVIPPTPSAWLRHLGPLAAGGLVVLAVAIAFGVALQRQVRVRTRQLARLLAEKDELARSLARSESRLRGILDEQSELICRWRPGGALSYVNEAYRRLLGLEREQLAERRFLADVPFGWRAAAERELAGLGLARPAATVELPVLLGGDTWRWVQWAVRAILDAAGEVGELQAVGRDVTERRAAEEALRRSEERLEMAVRTAGLGLWEWRVQADRVELDVEWASRLGLQASEVPAAWLRERVHPEDRERVERLLAAHLAGASPVYATELRVRAGSGEWLWLLHHGKLIERDAAGRPLRLLGVHLDLTEHKRVEERLDRAERLAALGTFAAGIAHELNNPIGAIRLAAEHVRARAGGSADGELAATLDDIVEDARRCGEIVRSVLRLASAAPPSREPTDLARIAREALEQTRALAAAAGTRIELAVDAALGEAHVCPADIRRLLVNLLRNAVQATGAGGRVRLAAATSAAGVRLTVEDDGPGLTEDERRRAFDPFYTTRRSEGGIGLGLSLCHALVSAHGGTIALEAIEAGGTRVTVEIPREAPARPGTAAADAAAAPRRAAAEHRA